MNDAICVVCDAPASYVTLGSWRCASHRDTTVVGTAPSAPGSVVVIEASAPRCYYHCVDNVHKCGRGNE